MIFNLDKIPGAGKTWSMPEGTTIESIKEKARQIGIEREKEAARRGITPEELLIEQLNKP